MNIFVIGDVHGCYFTFKKLIAKNWDPEKEYLVQLGDLINKGPHSVKCLSYFRKLQKKYPNRVILLRGNHEQMYLDYFQKEKKNRFIASLLAEIQIQDLDERKIFKWLRKTPLSWENDKVLISHAGISPQCKIPLREEDIRGVLYNRGGLKNIGKLQIAGHNIVEGNKPHFNPKENAWHIDTGAWLKKHLSALKIDADGNSVKVLKENRSKKDDNS